MSHFVRASGEALAASEDAGGEAPVLKLRKSEREKRERGSTPPHFKALPSSGVLWYLFIEMILPETQWPGAAPPLFDMLPAS